jgi:hypothetical protein
MLNILKISLLACAIGGASAAAHSVDAVTTAPLTITNVTLIDGTGGRQVDLASLPEHPLFYKKP